MAFGFIGKILGKFSGAASASKPQQQKGNGEQHGGRGRRKRRGRHAVDRQENGERRANGGTQNQGQKQQRQAKQPGQRPQKRQQGQQKQEQAKQPGQPQKRQQGQQKQGQQQNRPARQQQGRTSPQPQQKAQNGRQTPPQDDVRKDSQDAARQANPVPDAPAPAPSPADAARPEAQEAAVARPEAETPAAGSGPALPEETAAAILEAERQVVLVVGAEDKFRVLVNLMSIMSVEKTIVFCNKKGVAEELHRSLSMGGMKCGLLTGDVSEEDRQFVQGEFASGEMPLVVVTDGFCGGVDVSSVGCLVNYDFPYEAEDYVRRLGGEAGALSMGRVVSFADEDESSAIRDIEERLGVSMKCAVVQDGDPLLDEIAEEEAEPSEPPPPYERIKDGVPVFDAAGREGRLVIGGDGVPRPLPSFDGALDPKRPQTDETDVYVKPLKSDVAADGWTPTA